MKTIWNDLVQILPTFAFNKIQKSCDNKNKSLVYSATAILFPKKKWQSRIQVSNSQVFLIQYYTECTFLIQYFDNKMIVNKRWVVMWNQNVSNVSNMYQAKKKNFFVSVWAPGWKYFYPDPATAKIRNCCKFENKCHGTLFVKERLSNTKFLVLLLLYKIISLVRESYVIF